MTLRSPRRRFLAPAPLAALLLLMAAAACSKVHPRAETAAAVAEEPGSGEASAPVPREEAAPTRATLTDPRVSPYQHNPVSWRFVSTRVVDGARSDVRLAMTTTPERVVVPGVGLVFKLVLEVQLPDPEDAARVRSDYRSHVALLTPEGLYVSVPNVLRGDLAPAAAAQAADLRRDEPTWPLPGTLGCEGSVRDVALPFGAVRGVQTHCPSLTTPFGRAEVTTIWVDRVGLVYREMRLRDGEAAGDVYYDVLASGDLTELAPPAAGPAAEVGPDAR